MKMIHWLGVLWATMVLVMLVQWRIEIYMGVATIILPILIVLLNLQEELASLKEEAKHQRKFVMDRYTALNDRLADLSNHMEKKLVVDFSEFAKSSSSVTPSGGAIPTDEMRRRKKKKRPRPDEPAVDLTGGSAPASAPVPDAATTPVGQLPPLSEPPKA